MYVKFRLYNESEKPMNFFKIGIEYIFSGRYRGEFKSESLPLKRFLIMLGCS